MSTFSWRRRAIWIRTAAVTAGALAALSLMFPSPGATADPTEGVITYLNGDGSGTTSPTGPNIDPFAVAPTGATTQIASISGSKTATSLDAADQTNVTISFPAADYKANYDVVLVMDATQSYADVAPQAQLLLQDLAAELGTRTNTSINVGAVGYATTAYSSFTQPTMASGLMVYAAWTMFKNAASSGNWSTFIPSAPASIQPLMAQLKAVPGWPAGTFADGTTPVMPSGPSALSAVDLLNGLKPLPAGDASSITTELGRYGSALALNELLTYGIAAPYPSLTNTLGYSMTNAVIGTNLEAGIKAGQAILANSTTGAPPSNQFLVVVTDGGTYYWDGASGAAADQLSGARQNGNTISWGQAGFDWQRAPWKSDGLDFQAFLDTTGVSSDTTSQISIADWQANHANGSAWAGWSGLTTSFSDATAYPYVALEKGTAHAAAAFQAAVDTGENVVLLGSAYNPGNGRATAIAATWMDWAASRVSPSGVAVQYYPITAPATDVAAAFTSIKNQLLYAFDHGTLTDKIGSQFKLVTAGTAPTCADVTAGTIALTLAGVAQTCTMNGAELDFGNPTAGVYPYVLTYASNTLTLSINVPIETENALQLSYALELIRSTTPGWHENVPLNDEAVVDFTDSEGGTGTATFPVPVTAYYVPFHVVYDLLYKTRDVENYYSQTGGQWLTDASGVPYWAVGATDTSIPNPVPTRDGYTFGGWFADAACTIPWNFSTMPTTNVTLYAKWTQQDQPTPTPTPTPTTPAPKITVQAGGSVAR